jgi:Sulfotransferase domain
MALEVIGPGFGRTGTKSLKDALERLGFGPCHHMAEVIAHPEQVPYWQAVAAKKSVDWSAVFRGYRSQVDWPGAHVWRELIVAYPTAKVVLTVRAEAIWWDSFSTTIGQLMANYQERPLPPHVRSMLDAWAALAGQETFGDKFDDRDAALAAYRRRTEEVRSTVPPERLLVFDVAEGWEPLCQFLGKTIPRAPFPHQNTNEEFRGRFELD